MKITGLENIKTRASKVKLMNILTTKVVSCKQVRHFMYLGATMFCYLRWEINSIPNHPPP